MFRRYSDFGKAVVWIVGFINLVNSVIASIQFFSTFFDSETPSSQQLFSIIIGLSLIVFSVYFLCAISDWSFYTALAERGHLHTLRMVLLLQQDYTRKSIPLKGESAEFCYNVEKSCNGVSNVQYKHHISAIRRSSKRGAYSTWIFGDELVKPSALKTSLDGNPQPRVHPILVETPYKGHPDHNGLYRFQWDIPKGKRNDSIGMDICYTRVNAYKWDQDTVFIIYPKSFVSSIKTGTFSITCDAQDAVNILFIELHEIHSGFLSQQSKPQPLHREQDGKRVTFSTDKNIPIQSNSVYALAVKIR